MYAAIELLFQLVTLRLTENLPLLTVLPSWYQYPVSASHCDCVCVCVCACVFVQIVVCFLLSLYILCKLFW